MLTNISDNGFQIVVIAVGCRHIAFSLMPEQALDVNILRQLRQTVVYLLTKSSQQRFPSGIHTPEPTVRTTHTSGVDCSAAHCLLDYIKGLLPILLQQIVDDGVEAPTISQILTTHSGSKRFELSRCFKKVPATVVPFTIVIMYIFRQFCHRYPSVSITLPRNQYHRYLIDTMKCIRNIRLTTYDRQDKRNNPQKTLFHLISSLFMVQR